LHMRTTLNFGHCTKTLRNLDACLCQVCPQRKISKILLLHDNIWAYALPSAIKTEFNNPKKSKAVLQKFLYKKSFYSLGEYFDLQ
jgi:hypothetical protein